MKSCNKTCKKNSKFSRNAFKNIKKHKLSNLKEKSLSKEIKKETKIENKPFIFTGSENFSEISHDKYHGFTTQQMTIPQSSFENNGNNFLFSYNDINDNINEVQKDDNNSIINFDINKYGSNF